MNGADYTNLMNLLHTMSNKLDTIIELLRESTPARWEEAERNKTVARLRAQAGEFVDASGNQTDRRLLSLLGEDE